jgi:hypothetical protein
MEPPDSAVPAPTRPAPSRRPLVPGDSRNAAGVMMPDGSSEGFGLGFVKVEVDAKLLTKMTKKEAIAKFVKRLNEDLHRGAPDPNPDIDFEVDPATDELKLVYNDKAEPPEKKGKSVDGSMLGTHMKELARLIDDPKNTTKIMLVANGTKLKPPKTGAHNDKVFVPTALVDHVAYVNIEAIEQYEKLGPDAWKGLKSDPMNLVAGIYQELRQDERIRNDKSGDDKKTKYVRADNETAWDTNDLLKELNVPYHPVKTSEDGSKHLDRGGWWSWCPHDKRWRAQEDFPAPGSEAFPAWEKFMKEHPETDGEGGYDPKTGLLLASNWADPSDGTKVYVQYLQGDGDGNISNSGMGHIPLRQSQNGLWIPKKFSVKE